MNWIQPDKYHIRSGNGRFMVAKLTYDDGFRYLLWVVSPWGWNLVGRFDSAADAKSAAEVYAATPHTYPRNSPKLNGYD